MSDSATHYMLRRTLPLWKAEETIAEALEFARVNAIDEIIWKTDTEAFSHGLPPLEMIGEYLPWLTRARELLAADQICSSINPWVTMNHADRGRSAHLYHPDMRMFTNAAGREHSCRPCPMDKAWQAWLVEAYELYASTIPEILWLEDDLTNNPKECRGVHLLEYGCFCSEHLQAISRLSGESWDRQGLLQAIKQPGDPHPVRKLWFDLHGATMIALGEQLEGAVHRASPETKLGLMLSWANDGRWWDEFMRVVSGPHRPVVRPSLSSYNELRPTIHLFDQQDHRKECRCVPADSRICPELENSCYTAYSKSARFTQLELGLSALMGYPEITLNLFDHMGTPMAAEARYARLLGELKPRLSAIASRRLPGGDERAVGVLFRKTASDVMRLEDGQTSFDLQPAADGEAWGAILQGAGIPVKWHDADILCTSGQALRACAQDEVEALLSRSLLIDGSALEILCEMGFAAHAGCRFEKWIARLDTLVSVEELAEQTVQPQHPSAASPAYMALHRAFVRDRFCAMAVDDRATVASHLVNNDRDRVEPGMVFFENELGGRVVVYPFDLSRGTHVDFHNWHRKEQMRRAVSWLGHGRLDLHVEGGAWMIPFRVDYDDYIFVGLVNLETDGWDKICLTLNTQREVQTVERVEDDGSWRRCDVAIDRDEQSNVRIAIDERLEYMDFTAFVITA